MVDSDSDKGFLWAGVAISFGFFMFRIFVRVKVFRRLFPDDALVLAAWLMMIAYAAIWQWCGDQLYLSVAVASGKLLMPPPDFLDQLETFLHGLFVAYYMFYTCLWSIKMSFLLFFLKLGHNVRRQKTLWWSVFAFTIASYAVCLGLVDYSCLLGSKMHLASKNRHPSVGSPTANQCSWMLKFSHHPLSILLYSICDRFGHPHRCVQ